MLHAKSRPRGGFFAMRRRSEVCGYKVVGDFDKSEITLCELRFHVVRVLTKVLGGGVS